MSAVNTPLTRRGLLLGASAVAALGLPSTRVAYAADGSARAERADAVAAALHTAQPTPALALAVARPGGVVWSSSAGHADVELAVACTASHRFRLGSVSKVVTAVAASRLVSQGLLDLDAPISTWLTDLPATHRGTTLAQLLTHRGGIRHYLPGDLDPAQPGGGIDVRRLESNEEILALFIHHPLVAPPGTQVHYSSFGFTLASMVMEAAAGRPFLELVKDDIAKVFRLPSLGADDPAQITPLRVRGYSGNADRWSNTRPVTPAYCWAGAGLLMTASDTARFGAALLDSAEARITAGERERLFTVRTAASKNSPPLGLAWRIDRDAKDRRRFHHAGATIGGRASLVVYPDLGLSIALVSNVMTTPRDVLTPSADLADAFA